MTEDKAWLEWEAISAHEYDNLNYNQSLQSSVMRAGHQLAEKSFSEDTFFGRVLEVGAGTGEHFPFVRHSFDEYVLSDLDSRALNVAQHKLAELNKGKLRFEAQSADKLSYADNSFDRVIAAHILEHVYYPHLALKEWARVIKDGGTLTVLIPTDPGFTWRLGRHFGPRKHHVKLGVAYDYVMARQHVNPCNNLITFIRHYFPQRKEAWYPFPFSSMDINLFFVCHATVRK